MRINVSNKEVLEKVVATIKRMEEYKKKLDRFASSVSGETTSDRSARPPSFLLTHFTSRSNAELIIQDQKLRINREGYIAFTELNPFEFNTITQKTSRSFGFGFFKEELLKQKPDLFVPLAFADRENHHEILELLQNDKFRKYLVKSSAKGQPSILFSNMLEIRSIQNIDLKLCRLFFRNQEIDPQFEQELSDLGIFQLPHRVRWYSTFFLENQKWVYKEQADYILFYDNRSKFYTEGDRLISSEELIAKIKGKVKKTNQQTVEEIHI